MKEIEEKIDYILRECFGFGNREYELQIVTDATNKILSIPIVKEKTQVCPMCLGESPTCSFCKSKGIIYKSATIRDAIEEYLK